MKPGPKPTPQQKEEKRDPVILLFSILLVGLAGYFLYLGFQDPRPDRPQLSEQQRPSVNQTADYQEKVNKHLKETYNDIKLKESITHFENLKEAPRLKEANQFSPPPDSLDQLQFNGDPRMSELPEIMGRNQAPDQPDTMDPDHLIQKKLFEDQQAKKYDQAYKEAYAKKYIENALKKGWIIKLNEKFEVISMTPVNKKRLPTLFDNKQNTNSKAK